MWVFQSTLIFEKTHYSSVEEAFLIIQICLQYALIGPEGAVETKIEINPRGVKIKANTVGFFIANDAEEVRRANTFCKVTDQYDRFTVLDFKVIAIYNTIFIFFIRSLWRMRQNCCSGLPRWDQGHQPDSEVQVQELCHRAACALRPQEHPDGGLPHRWLFPLNQVVSHCIKAHCMHITLMPKLVWRAEYTLAVFILLRMLTGQSAVWNICQSWKGNYFSASHPEFSFADLRSKSFTRPFQ